MVCVLEQVAVLLWGRVFRVGHSLRWHRFGESHTAITRFPVACLEIPASNGGWPTFNKRSQSRVPIASQNRNRGILERLPTHKKGSELTCASQRPAKVLPLLLSDAGGSGG